MSTKELWSTVWALDQQRTTRTARSCGPDVRKVPTFAKNLPEADI
jgi:hypothetical protein